MSIDLTMNSGVTLPAIGFGVFQTPPAETMAAVTAALAAGYRHLDTAAAYGNEREVGQAIRTSGLDREEVFIETKNWVSDYGYDNALHAFDKASEKLGVDQIDLLILHQPLPSEFDLAIAAYRALQTLLADGKVRAIGVSNFMPAHLDRLLDAVEVTPAVNQIEVHPYFRNSILLAKNDELGILSQAWSPIGGITFYPGRGGDRRSTLTDPVLGAIGQAHRSAASSSRRPGRVAAHSPGSRHRRRPRCVSPPPYQCADTQPPAPPRPSAAHRRSRAEMSRARPAESPHHC